MKTLYIIFLLFFVKQVAFSQDITINPLESAEHCPNTDIIFSVSLTAKSLGELTNSGGAFISQQIYDRVISGNSISFKFRGRFSDVNIGQSFIINYVDINSQSKSRSFIFNKIKSLLHISNESIISIANPNIIAQRCQIQNFNISFANVKYVNTFVNPRIVYGSVTNYEYQLPSGWSLGGTTSNGSNWIAGSNNVTVTSNLNGGNGSTIKVRPVNTACGILLQPGQISEIAITRPRPSLTINGNNTICAGTSTYSINGTLTPGSTVCWSLGTNGSASIPSSSYCGNSVPVSYVGVGASTLVATVTDCIETYELPRIEVVTGLPAVDRFIVQGERFDYVSLGPGTNFLICPFEKIMITPNLAIDRSSILENSWEYVSGTYGQLGSSNTFTALLTPSYNVGSTLELRYRYRNSCGWSNYEYINFTSMNCDGGEEPYRVSAENENTFDFTISPNPAKDNVLISTQGIIENYEIRIYDVMTSRQLKFKKIEKGKTNSTIDVSDLKGGIYIVTVTSKNKSLSKQLRIDE